MKNTFGKQYFQYHILNMISIEGEIDYDLEIVGCSIEVIPLYVDNCN